MQAEVRHLGEPSSAQITSLIRQTLGDRALPDDSEWPACDSAALVLVIECEQDGELCTAARKFLRESSKPERRLGGRKVACLALARSVCVNSANMLGADKFKGAARIQRALMDQGCTPLVEISCVEIELEDVDASVVPWARTLAGTMDAIGGPDAPTAPAATTEAAPKTAVEPTRALSDLVEERPDKCPFSTPVVPLLALAAAATVLAVGLVAVIRRR